MIRIWIFLNTNKNVSRFSWFLCFLFFKYYLATLQVYSKQNDAILFQQAQALLRIHLILIRLRILDPHWKTMDPDPGHEHFLKIYWFFFLSRIVYIIFLLFMLKLDEPFRDQEFFLVFGLYFAAWIRILGSAFFCLTGSGSRKPKSCGYNGSGWLALPAGNRFVFS